MNERTDGRKALRHESPMVSILSERCRIRRVELFLNGHPELAVLYRIL